jgi:hypothetical protein
MPRDVALAEAARSILRDLKVVDLYVLGADAAGHGVLQWDRMRESWIAHFNEVQANLKRYSIVRVLPDAGS